MLSFMLLVIGVAGLLGTFLIGACLKNNLYRTLIVIPLLMAAIAIALVGFGGSITITTVLLGLWGLVGHGGARRLVDLAFADAAGRCRSRRRPDGGDRPARHRRGRDSGRPSVRPERLSRDLRNQCGGVGRCCCSCGAGRSVSASGIFIGYGCSTLWLGGLRRAV